MRLYLIRITFHENLFYATRETGRLYETGRFLHNYALTYALGLAQAPYYQPQQTPQYALELETLNKRGVYVTAGRGVRVNFELATFKFANNAYRVKMAPGSRNTPSYGRAKEIAVGSQFELALISSQEIPLPRWIRMGLWHSKALVECLGEAQVKTSPSAEQIASLPLNPLDVTGDFLVYDLISMPPSSLLDNARLKCEWLTAEVAGRSIWLPAGMKYNFP